MAILRSYAGRNPGDRSLMELIGELSTRSEPFRAKWANHNVRFHRTGVKRLHHPVVGDLELAYEAMEMPADPGLTMFAYTAEPASPSEERLKLLASWAATDAAAAAAAAAVGSRDEAAHGDAERLSPQVVATASSDRISDPAAPEAVRTTEARVLESGQGSDAIAGEREDEEADAVARAAGVAQVGAERGLPVRARRHEVEPAPGVEDGAEEPRRRARGPRTRTASAASR